MKREFSVKNKTDAFRVSFGGNKNGSGRLSFNFEYWAELIRRGLEMGQVESNGLGCFSNIE